MCILPHNSFFRHHRIGWTSLFLAPAVDFQGSHRWSFQCCCSQGIRPSKWMLQVWHGSILWTSHAWSIEQLTSFRYRWWRSQLKLWTSWMIFLAWPSVCWVGDVNEVGHPCQQKEKGHVHIMMDVEGKKFRKARGRRWKIYTKVTRWRSQCNSQKVFRYDANCTICCPGGTFEKLPFLTLCFSPPKFPAWIIVVEHSQLHSAPWCSHKLPSPQWSQSLKGVGEEVHEEAPTSVVCFRFEIWRIQFDV